MRSSAITEEQKIYNVENRLLRPAQYGLLAGAMYVGFYLGNAPLALGLTMASLALEKGYGMVTNVTMSPQSAREHAHYMPKNYSALTKIGGIFAEKAKIGALAIVDGVQKLDTELKRRLS